MWSLPRHVTDGLLKGSDAAQAAQYVAMEKATAAEVLKAQEEAPHTSGQPLPGVGVPGDVKAEVVPLTVHHAQSSPVVIQPSQLSSALLNPAQHAPGGPGPHPASAPAATQEAPSALPSPQMPGDGSSVQSLFIEEIHSVSARSRAVSIEVGPPSISPNSVKGEGWGPFPPRTDSLVVETMDICIKDVCNFIFLSENRFLIFF